MPLTISTVAAADKVTLADIGNKFLPTVVTSEKDLRGVLNGLSAEASVVELLQVQNLMAVHHQVTSCSTSLMKTLKENIEGVLRNL